MVVLKRLADAERDGDPIHAMLEASQVGHDGHAVGITAPSRDAQLALIQACWAKADIEAGDLSFVEAHGTGTLAGVRSNSKRSGPLSPTGRTTARPAGSGP